MKSKLMSKFKQIVLFFSVVFLFQNCQKEDDLLITDNDQAETYKTVTLDNVLKLKPIVESIKRIRLSTSNIDFRTRQCVNRKYYPNYQYY
ncbi:hypothetical protein [Olleya sp. 1-3]|nr:hypothetical protein [Olleya sp. 1-3]PKG53386.1 hypothetical protein CXF54_00775 [Olleya sp. 1-3]